jgi:hypothetical protein
VDRGGEALDLLFVEVARERVRRELRGVEDLVRPRAADPGDEALVAEERVQAPRIAWRISASCCRVERVASGPRCPSSLAALRA